MKKVIVVGAGDLDHKIKELIEQRLEHPIILVEQRKVGKTNTDLIMSEMVKELITESIQLETPKSGREKRNERRKLNRRDKHGNIR